MASALIGPKTYRCDQCKARFLRSQSLAGHKRFVHEGFRTQGVTPPSVTGKKAKAKRKARRRIRCKECGKLLSSLFRRARHMVIVHGKGGGVGSARTSSVPRPDPFVNLDTTPTNGHPVAEVKFCPFCGAGVWKQEGAKFCVGCGAKIERLITNGQGSPA